jgi:hypothetical protein
MAERTYRYFYSSDISTVDSHIKVGYWELRFDGRIIIHLFDVDEKVKVSGE